MSNLTNDDFKNLINQAAPTQRIPQHRHRNSNEHQIKNQPNPTKNQPTQKSKYRDRADERRRGIVVEDEPQEESEEESDGGVDADELEEILKQKLEQAPGNTSKVSAKASIQFKSTLARNVYNVTRGIIDASDTQNIFRNNTVTYAYDGARKSSNSIYSDIPRVKVKSLTKSKIEERIILNENQYETPKSITLELSNIIGKLEKMNQDSQAYFQVKSGQILRQQQLDKIKKQEEAERIKQECGSNIFGDDDDADEEYVCEVEYKSDQSPPTPTHDSSSTPPPSSSSSIASSESHPNSFLTSQQQQQLLEKVKQARAEQNRIAEQRTQQKFSKKDYETGYAALFKNPLIKSAPTAMADEPSNPNSEVMMDYDSGVESPDDEYVMRNSSLQDSFKELKELEGEERGGRASRGRGRGGRGGGRQEEGKRAGVRKAVNEKKQKANIEWQQMENVFKRKYGDDFATEMKNNQDDGSSKKKKKKSE
ncbi:pks41 [Acrasis kona]|uniref:Pks41 n=1 Tax=Acrasis kona TaxID=1008807 RepID=A0AAW2ZL72_9EUKA